jgi:hypothetical protein
MAQALPKISSHGTKSQGKSRLFLLPLALCPADAAA